MTLLNRIQSFFKRTKTEGKKPREKGKAGKKSEPEASKTSEEEAKEAGEEVGKAD